ncbi:6,7-dimethyl-8-ribityllumazine synthase [Candidatus Woesearchaeota archaeon]|nr:6,7-dimethyl-8-ribityllumazine synthase [Candidatus Woesearchaeota archaeon]
MKHTLGIVVSDYNSEITHRMLSVAEQRAKQLGAAIGDIIHVPGAYEIPFAAMQLLGKKEIDAVVALGAILQGETAHDEVIAYSTARSLQELSLKYNKPVGLGISGPRMTKEQAAARIESFAKNAIEACLNIIHLKAADE